MRFRRSCSSSSRGRGRRQRHARQILFCRPRAWQREKGRVRQPVRCTEHSHARTRLPSTEAVAAAPTVAATVGEVAAASSASSWQRASSTRAASAAVQRRTMSPVYIHRRVCGGVWCGGTGRMCVCAHYTHMRPLSRPSTQSIYTTQPPYTYPCCSPPARAPPATPCPTAPRRRRPRSHSPRPRCPPACATAGPLRG